MRNKAKNKFTPVLILTAIIAVVGALIFLWLNYFQQFKGTVVSVADGDTITVRHNGKDKKIRLLALDAPEIGQNYSYRSKEYVSTFVLNKQVTVRHQGKRCPYGRLLGWVILEDGTNFNHQLVREGMAWWYEYFNKDKNISAMENAARKNRRGLWWEQNPTPPWEWRRRNGWKNW